MPEPLTERQAAILEFITEVMTAGKRPPSIREIAARFRIGSPTTVRDHLAALERKGYIERRPGEKRSIALTPEYENTLGVPLVGDVAARTPILAEENITEYLQVDQLFPRDGRHFGLRVRGDSMVDEGILDGDFVIVLRKPTFENGEVGVAVIGGECTVKRLHKDGQTVRLVPANDAYDEIAVDLAEEEFRYGGEVVGVLRLRDVAQRRA